MLYKLDKSCGIKYIKKIGLFAIVAVFLFFNFFTPSYAQSYSQNPPVFWYSPSVFSGSSNINSYDYRNNQSEQTTIATANATNITPTSATLNALINGNTVYDTYNFYTWFDYGPTVNLGTSSSGHAANYGYASFVSTISGLTPNTVYYFRAMGQNSKGIIYGTVNAFRTTIPPLPEANTNINTNNNVNNNTVTAPSATSLSVQRPLVSVKKEATNQKQNTDIKQDLDTKNINISENNSFLPVTVLGWVLLLILLLVLILIIKQLHHKFSGKKYE
jgi:hypothetical protein